jgi:hypoxanthine-DNA glycosylase
MGPKPTLEISTGFPPVVARASQVLILGSLPGRASLAAGQYYAQPRNAFWGIMGGICGAGRELDYAARLDRLLDAGIALWDVLAAAHRPGSLDAAIRSDTLQVNDFAQLFRRANGIRLIAFNGRKAADLFERHVVLPDMPATVSRVVLPSTSPAYAEMSLAAKCQAWTAALHRHSPLLLRTETCS